MRFKFLAKIADQGEDRIGCSPSQVALGPQLKTVTQFRQQINIVGLSSAFGDVRQDLRQLQRAFAAEDAFAA